MDQQTILNVDDYPPGRYARTKILRQAGFNVLESDNGAETLRLVAEHRPALVLLDVNLPDMNGFEVCRRIRDNPVLAATTIVHVSASNTLPHHQVYGLDSGADGYLVEPLEPSVLIATVNAYLRMRRAEEALRRSNRGLEEFAFVISHDLQEPLRTISIFTERLITHLRPHLDEESAKQAIFVQNAVTRMGRLIRDLLEISRLIHDGTAGEGTTDAGALLVRVLAGITSDIEAQGASITHDPLPVVRVNEVLLEQVFRNLISNALKYRKEEEAPVIHISARRDASWWAFSVKDNGIGFDPKYKERIFGLFKRLHGQEYPGSGVGLAICSRVIEQAGGRIWAESELGTGSTFVFTLRSADSAPPRTLIS